MMDPAKNGTGFRVYYPETGSYDPPTAPPPPGGSEPAPNTTSVVETTAAASGTSPVKSGSSDNGGDDGGGSGSGDDGRRLQPEGPGSSPPAPMKKGPYYASGKPDRDIAPQKGPYDENPHSSVDFNVTFAGSTPGPEAAANAKRRRSSMLEQARNRPEVEDAGLEPNLRTHMEPRRKSLGAPVNALPVAPAPSPERTSETW